MAASVNDKLDQVTSSNTGRPVVTTLSGAGHSIAGTSVTIAAATNWSTTTGIHFSIYETTTVGGATVKDSSTQTDWKGTLASTTISNMTITGGTDRAYSAGAIVEITPTARWAKDLYDWGIAEHKQDGTHEDITATSIVVADAGTLEVDTINEATAANGVTVDGMNIKDGYVVGGATSGIKNASLGTEAGGLGAAWQSWTPTPTNFTVGTGGSAAIVAEYIQIGKTVHFRLVGTLGTSGFSVGAATFTLPVTASAAAATQARIGVGFILDSSAGTYEATTTINSTTVMGVAIINTTFTYSATDGISSTKPMTWAANDKLVLTGTYEAA